MNTYTVSALVICLVVFSFIFAYLPPKLIRENNYKLRPDYRYGQRQLARVEVARLKDEAILLKLQAEASLAQELLKAHDEIDSLLQN